MGINIMELMPLKLTITMLQDANVNMAQFVQNVSILNSKLLEALSRSNFSFSTALEFPKARPNSQISLSRKCAAI